MPDNTASTKPASKPRPKRRKRIFAAIAISLGCFFAIVASELALRVYVAVRGWTPNCYATGLVFFVPHETAGYTLRPGLRLKSSTYDVTVNSLGFRGPELVPEPARVGKRVVVLGGSSVFGYLVPEGEDSCAALQRLFGRRLPEVEVINAGVPGFNMRQCRNRYISDIARLKPDYVLLYLGWNDTRLLLTDHPETLDLTPPAPGIASRILGHSALYGFLRYRLFPRPTPKFAPPASMNGSLTNVGKTAFKRELDELLEAVLDSGAMPIVCTQVMASAAEGGLDDYLGTSHRQIAFNKQLGDWITECMRTTAQETNLTLIDCAESIESDATVLGDAIHLTPEGHALVARAWYDALVSKMSADGTVDQKTRTGNMDL